MSTVTTHKHFCDRCGAEIDAPKIARLGDGESVRELSISWAVNGAWASEGKGWDMLCEQCVAEIIAFLTKRRAK